MVALDEVRAAMERSDHVGAIEALGDEPPEGPDATLWFELRAEAAYGGLPYDDAVSAWEQLHRHHRSLGNRLEAARAAMMTAVFLLIDSGLMSAVRGWTRRAE